MCTIYITISWNLQLKLFKLTQNYGWIKPYIRAEHAGVPRILPKWHIFQLQKHPLSPHHLLVYFRCGGHHSKKLVSSSPAHSAPHLTHKLDYTLLHDVTKLHTKILHSRATIHIVYKHLSNNCVRYFVRWRQAATNYGYGIQRCGFAGNIYTIHATTNAITRQCASAAHWQTGSVSNKWPTESSQKPTHTHTHTKYYVFRAVIHRKNTKMCVDIVRGVSNIFILEQVNITMVVDAPKYYSLKLRTHLRNLAGEEPNATHWYKNFAFLG